MGSVIETIAVGNQRTPFPTAKALLFYALAYSVLALLDNRAITKLGHGQVPGYGWFLLPPIYLWRRTTCLGWGRGLFWLWIACFAAGIGLIEPSLPDVMLLGN